MTIGFGRCGAEETPIAVVNSNLSLEAATCIHIDSVRNCASSLDLGLDLVLDLGLVYGM